MLKRFGSNVKIACHDGTMEGMMDLFQAMAPSIVFHLASCFTVEHNVKDVQRLVESNILFGLQLVEAMTASNIRHLINTGTSWQNFNNEDYNPVNLYAASKEAFEVLLRYYAENRGLKTITLKLFDTYGPDDPRPKLFALLRSAEEGRQELALSPGEQLIDIVYIDDVVDAFMMAEARIRQDAGGAHEEYAVSSGRRLTLKELVETYQRVTEKELNIQWGGRPYRTREVMVPWSSGHRLEGWSPKVPIEIGIKLVEMSTPATV
jgi:nucleoside-diphosphate-sugar epimerase